MYAPGTQHGATSTKRSCRTVRMHVDITGGTCGFKDGQIWFGLPGVLRSGLEKWTAAFQLMHRLHGPGGASVAADIP